MAIGASILLGGVILLWWLRSQFTHELTVAEQRKEAFGRQIPRYRYRPGMETPEPWVKLS